MHTAFIGPLTTSAGRRQAPPAARFVVAEPLPGTPQNVRRTLEIPAYCGMLRAALGPRPSLPRGRYAHCVANVTGASTIGTKNPNLRRFAGFGFKVEHRHRQRPAYTATS